MRFACGSLALACEKKLSFQKAAKVQKHLIFSNGTGKDPERAVPKESLTDPINVVLTHKKISRACWYTKFITDFSVGVKNVENWCLREK